MTAKELNNVESIKSNALVTEVLKLYRDAVSVRNLSGVTTRLQYGYIRDAVEGCEGEPIFVTTQEDCSDECSTGDDKTSNCDEELPQACSLEDMAKKYEEMSPFKSVANLLTTVKKYEFISLVENAYAQIGNKPFQLKASKVPTFTDEQIEESAKLFYEFLENFLEVNQVRVTEIADAFNLDTLSQVTETLADEIQQAETVKINESVEANEAVLERVFQRAEFMDKYIEVIKDTTCYPIGIMWIDDKSMKKERVIESGKMVPKYSIQADAHRVDPCYFWATQDYRLNEVGRAVFRLTQYTSGDLMRWVDSNITGSAKISEFVTEYLETHEHGYRMYDAMLFRDHYDLMDGMYDVMITRGTYTREYIEDLDVEIPEIYNHETHIPCEIYFSGTTILRVRVMMCLDKRLGVYTTLFRRRGQSIFGWSLHDFVYPFAKMYQGSVDAIDRSVGKSIGSFIQIDTGVIDDPGKFLKINKDGEAELDLSDDVVVEFDSTEAFASPNFRGVPITVTELPSDLNKLLPAIEFIWTQLERISGIPSILVNASNVSSALRTNSNFNAAFGASAKVVQSLLRGSEVRMLEPSIQYIFDAKAMSGEMQDFLLEAEPEILLSDTLTRELNDDQQLLTGLQSIAQFAQLVRIPEEQLAKLVNTVGREVYHFDEDIIPGTGALSTTTPSTPAQSV